MTASRARQAAPAIASEAAVAELLDQFIERIQNGWPADPLAFAAEHPEHAEALLAILPAAAAVVALREPSLVERVRPGHPFHLDSDRLGDYRIIREVGRGGMGVVYEAEQIAIGRRLALKVLPRASAMDPRRLARFRVEAQAASTLNHPHIVPVFAVGCEQGVHYYAMQFIDGCSLADVLAGLRPWPGTGAGASRPRAAAELILQAAEALEHAHGLGVLHRDVKPANLLVDPSGHLWVADFGLARFLEGGDLTRTGDVIGTLRYLSPEQASGRTGYDPRSDVYGLGATLYEMLTLRPPFDGDDRQDLLRWIADREPVAPRKLDPAIPRDLETVLLRAMAKEPAERYGSAEELSGDLRRFLDGRPVLARRPGLGRRVTRWALRHRLAVSTAAVVLALAVIGLAVGAGLLWREQSRARENLRAALTALDEYCLSTCGMEFTRDPERAQEVRGLQVKALAIYERVLGQNPDDPEVRWGAARSHHRVANILAGSQHRPDEVERAYREADRHLALLVAAAPESLRFREELADTLSDWGAWLMQRKPGAGAVLRRALAAHRRLAAEYPGEARYRRAVSRDCLELSKTIGIVDPVEAAEKERLQREAVELRRTLRDGSFVARADLSEAEALFAHLLVATGRRAEGDALMGSARDIARRLEVDFPTDPTCRHKVVRLESLFAVPRYCGRPADPEEDLRACRSVMAAEERLAAEFPFVPDFRVGLAWSHHYFSSHLRRLDRLAEAEAEDRRAVELFEAVIQEHPTVEPYRRLMASVCEGLGQTLVATGRPREAVPYLRRAVELVPESGALRERVDRLLASSVTPMDPEASTDTRRP
jgi:tetratricopeptide (TPR) repeat protein